MKRTFMDELNRLAKWRTVFTGWQLGTRPKSDPESQAIRDHREATLLLRVEVSTLLKLLIDKKVFTIEEFHATIADEAVALNAMLEAKFPGMKATDAGIQYDSRAAETMKGWLP